MSSPLPGVVACSAGTGISFSTETTTGVLSLEVGPWLGTSLINREEAHFSEHEYRSEMVKGIWVGPECQIRALEIPPPAGQD